MKFFIFILLIISCNNNAVNDVYEKDSIVNDPGIIEKKSGENIINIKSFKKLPAEIEGCSGLFFLDSIDKKKGEYVFVSDLQSKAFIMIDDEMIELKNVDKQNSEGVIKEYFTSGKYKLQINVKLEKQLGYELWLYKGTIKLSDDSTTIIKNIIGEVGC